MHSIRGRAKWCRGLAAVLLLVAPATQAFEWRDLALSGDLGAGFDSNLNNAPDAGSERTSAFATTAVRAGFQHSLGPQTLLLLRGDAQIEAVEQYPRLNNARLGAQARLSHRTGSGFFAPMFTAYAGMAVLEFDSRIRDSNEYRAGVQVSEALTTKVNARLGLEATWRDSGSEVFDLRGQSAGLDLDWRAAPRLTVYTGYRYSRGDTVSSSALVPAKSSHLFNIVRAADVIEPDDAYGGLAAGEFAYRIDTNTHVARVGFNHALSRRWAVDAQVQSVRADAGGGLHYARWAGMLNLLARF